MCVYLYPFVTLTHSPVAVKLLDAGSQLRTRTEVVGPATTESTERCADGRQ